MSLFFDADWFDAKLAARGLDRGALAEAAGLERSELHLLFTNERAASAADSRIRGIRAQALQRCVNASTGSQTGSQYARF